MRLGLGLAVLGVLAAAPALAEGCRPTREIRFAPRASSAVAAATLGRGEVACFFLAARAGQRLEAGLDSAERNAVLQIYQPGWRLSPEGAPVGHTRPGGGAGEDATLFAGPVPVAGRYLVVVGATRGGVTFSLHLAVR